MADYLAALPLGFILSFSFGPLFFILLETSISKGLKQAFFMDLGVAFSDFVFFRVIKLSTTIQYVRARVCKINPPIDGDVENVSVEIKKEC